MTDSSYIAWAWSAESPASTISAAEDLGPDDGHADGQDREPDAPPTTSAASAIRVAIPRPDQPVARARPVADAADGGDVARTLGVVAELVAQPPDVDVDGPVEDLGLVLAVDRIEQLVAGQDAAVGLDQRWSSRNSTRVRAIGSPSRVTSWRSRSTTRSARTSGGCAGAGVGRRGGGAAQDRLDAQDELGRRERLGQVVVGAVLEAGDAVERRAAGRDDQDRRGGRLVVAADGPDDGPPVQLGEHQVEDDERRPVALDGIEGSRAVGRGHDREARRARGTSAPAGRSWRRRRRRGSVARGSARRVGSASRAW